MASESSKVARVNAPVAKSARLAHLVVATGEVEEIDTPFFTPESLKGWASSLALHAVFLLCLAFWYFAPSVSAQRPLNAKLAGSERGVEEGLTLTGGLNTTITLPADPTPAPADPIPAALAPLDVPSLEPKVGVNFSGAEKASADGGIENRNPGAGNGDGFGLAKFGQGGESIRGVEVKVGDPQFTLIWDNDADLDLHVIEPGGKEIYWEDPKGKEGLGGELDVDNTKGYGPENVYWLRDDPTGEGKVKGTGPAGEYKWFVVYWGGFGGIPKPTRWKVRIKHDDRVTVVTGKFRALNERSRIYSLTVKPLEAEASSEPLKEVR
ncbi:YfaP family protein [Singulisphaera acidiphila]|uniref:DUF2135 domain-containing protein n=1 Tax=Singulisphaera acidiphila (strain ATCC BAA-1392 / DSM 18658 / VKM B-2454 / MOB10) TaxID=886293 RepID=L0D9Q5_SINAD|nr:hypothetical protein [Singulisphaera acidiphila]AGA26124.1 hypothetical protein Sinac_1753 [Singulisphaera acidiphila DSM 18658]